MTVDCLGCGQPLPDRASRGRPARYHGPACRQRARRARIAADPDRTELLTVAKHAEQAALALRWAAASGHDPRAAVDELLAAIAPLAAPRDNADVTSPTMDHACPTAEPVTKSVTEKSVTPPRPVEPLSEPTQGRTSRPSNISEGVAKKVTKSPAKRARRQARATGPIDVDTVRLERGADYDTSGTWRVVAGAHDDPIVIGFLRRHGLSKKWQANTASWITVSGGPWRTRQDALVQLLLHHERRAQPSRARAGSSRRGMSLGQRHPTVP